jgi:hypothetical protein
LRLKSLVLSPHGTEVPNWKEENRHPAPARLLKAVQSGTILELYVALDTLHNRDISKSTRGPSLLYDPDPFELVSVKTEEWRASE